MKKIGSILSVVVLVGILLSSCASQKNGLAIKRKYNKGYYIAHNHKKNNESVKENNTDKVVKVTESKKLNVVEAELPPVKTILSVVNSENLPVAKAEKINDVKHNTVIIDTKNATASTVTEKTKTVHKEVNIEKESAKSSSGSSDSQLILLVILSIFPFLALLAMYLKDGKQVTLNFWVDLILHLTFIGYIIFALLVVFDVVNLA
jgi:nitrous oxide reductase